MRSELPPPILIEDAAGLAELARRLEGEREIAFDTEADSFFSYREKVCLIQVTAGGQDYLVDPLSGIDLAPLGEVLADPERTVVFHDGEYDVLLLKRDHAFEFAGLFDTRVAAAALGFEAPGLAAVLSQRFGVELDKSMQRSDWSRRPLTPKQIDYARLDTHYLLELAREQRAELEQLGRTEIVEGECRRLEALRPPPAEFDPDDFARIKGAGRLDPEGRRALRELFVMRDAIACRRDVSPFRVVNNATLLALAQRRPRTAAELAQGLSPRQQDRIGREVLAALERARELGPLKELPRARRRDGTDELDETGQELHERLKSWRKRRAEREGYDSALLLNRHVLVRLAKEAPETLADLERTEGILPWQLHRFGRELTATIRTALKEIRAGGKARERRRRGRRGR